MDLSTCGPDICGGRHSFFRRHYWLAGSGSMLPEDL